jgi:hypothetical protein
MKAVKAILTVILIILTLNLYFPKVAFSEEFEDSDITKNTPDFVSKSQENIEKIVPNWPGIIANLLLLGGIGAGSSCAAGSWPCEKKPDEGSIWADW